MFDLELSLFDPTVSTIVVFAIFMSSRAKFDVSLWQTFNIKGRWRAGERVKRTGMIWLVLKSASECILQRTTQWNENKRFVILQIFQVLSTPALTERRAEAEIESFN